MYIYSSEILGGNMQKRFVALSFVGYVFGGVFANIFSMKWNHYSYYFYGNGGFTLLFSVSFFYFLETPFFFYKQRNIKGLYENLRAMCKRNNKMSEYESRKQKVFSILKQKMGSDLKIEDEMKKEFETKEPLLDPSPNLEETKSQKVTIKEDQEY